MFNKRSNNYDNIDLNNLKSYQPANHMDEDEYNNYNNNIQNIGPASKISSKNDVPIIKEMMELDSHFIALMKSRVNGLTSITNSYQSGRLEDSIKKIEQCKDLGVINDFFRYSLIKKDLNQINLNIDMALSIFPNIIKMINSKHDVYFKSGINTAWVILNFFKIKLLKF